MDSLTTRKCRRSVLRNYKVSSVSIDEKVLIQPFLYRQCLRAAVGVGGEQRVANCVLARECSLIVRAMIFGQDRSVRI